MSKKRYPKDLKAKVLEFFESGLSSREVATHFCLHIRTVYRWHYLWRKVDKLPKFLPKHRKTKKQKEIG